MTGERHPSTSHVEEPPDAPAAGIAAQTARLRPTGDVVIHHLTLDGEADDGLIAAHLTTAEEDRAQRFVRADVGRRFRRGRAALRAILAGYLRAAPESVVIECDPLKKPRLGGAHAGLLRFNASGSGGLAAVAVSATRELGVDVEPLSRTLDPDALAKVAFNDQEIAWLNAIAPDERRTAFLRLWTVKEAMLKACGVGLRQSAKTVQTSEAIRDGAGCGEAVLNARRFCVWDVSIVGLAASVAFPDH